MFSRFGSTRFQGKQQQGIIYIDVIIIIIILQLQCTAQPIPRTKFDIFRPYICEPFVTWQKIKVKTGPNLMLRWSDSYIHLTPYLSFLSVCLCVPI